MNKIKCVSLFFRVFFQIAFLCLAGAQMLGWVFTTNMNSGFFSVIPPMYQGHVFSPLTINTRIAGFFVSLLPLIFQLLVLYSLIKLFQLYEELKFFTLDNVRYIRNAGYALLLHQITLPLSYFVMGFVLTSINPPGLHYAMIELTDKNFMGILTALIIILISWIMAEGCKMQIEHEFII